MVKNHFKNLKEKKFTKKTKNGDLTCKSSSNFKSIGWKSRILEVWQICWPLAFFWPFNLLTSKTIDFLFMPNSTTWWSFVKIVLKLWPEGDKQTDRQTDRMKKITHGVTTWWNGTALHREHTSPGWIVHILVGRSKTHWSVGTDSGP